MFTTSFFRSVIIFALIIGFSSLLISTFSDLDDQLATSSETRQTNKR